MEKVIVVVRKYIVFYGVWLVMGLFGFKEVGESEKVGSVISHFRCPLSRPASQNSWKQSRDESRRRIYARKIPHVYTLSLKKPEQAINLYHKSKSLQ